MSALVLLGAGGHGRVVADTAEAAGFSSISFLDDAWPQRSKNGDWPIVGKIDHWPDIDATTAVFIAIGNNEARLRLGREIEASGRDRVPCIIHPRSVVSPRASIGQGSVVMAGSVVQAYARIGAFAIINTGATVDHDCQIGDGVHVSPGAHLAGTVTVSDEAWIGIGAVVREGCQIGKRTMIGAGATVISDVEDHQTMLGTPARPMRGT